MPRRQSLNSWRYWCRSITSLHPRIADINIRLKKPDRHPSNHWKYTLLRATRRIGPHYKQAKWETLQHHMRQNLNINPFRDLHIQKKRAINDTNTVQWEFDKYSIEAKKDLEDQSADMLNLETF